MKHLTEGERYQIEILIKEKYSIQQIANKLNKHRSTIYREIKKGTVTQLDTLLKEKEIYLADAGQRIYDENKIYKGANLKIGNDLELLRFITKKIKEEKYSPEAVIMHMKLEGLKFKTSICKGTIYNYIYKGVFLDLKEKDLPDKKNRKKKTAEDEKRTVALKNLGACSIEERPKDIKYRNDIGHWEMDTVVSGRGDLECLLVLSERASRFEKIIKIKGKKQKYVVAAINEIEKEIGTTNFRETFKTITVDNGVEFLDYEGIETCRRSGQQRTKVYFCHPYSSYERGTNENINRMIRRFVPKGCKISEYSKKDIGIIENWINNYPRKLLGGISAKMAYSRFAQEIPCF